MDVSVPEERGAIDQDAQILATLPPHDGLLHATVEEILLDEQEHLEELRTLVGE